MEKAKQDIAIAIIIATIIIVILAVFTLLFFLLFVRKRRILLHERQLMEFNFQQELLRAQLEIQEQTLQKISQEVHDNIGQILSLVSLNLNTIPTTDAVKREETSVLVDKAIGDLRDLSKSLNPERVLEVGILEAFEHELAQLNKTGKFVAKLYPESELFDIDPQKTIILYRIFQEVLNNVIKHADATYVTVKFRSEPGKHIISIHDDGLGYDTNSKSAGGVGLLNIRKRAELIGAEVEILSGPGKGTTVRLHINR